MKFLKTHFFKSFCLLIAGFLLLCTGLTGCADREAQFLMEDEAESQPETDNTDETEELQANASDKGDTAVIKQEPTEIYVDVCGAVASPGVYALLEGSRVFQAIEAAGGYLPEAAQTYVNRAQGLTDGQQVYIPTQEEIEKRKLEQDGQMAAGQPGAFGLEAAGGMFQSGGTPEITETESGKVNLNTADEAALTTLTGIGASKARSIIAYREANGPFQAIEDIMQVEGIKEGTFSKIKDDIVVG